jgi:hypothetical protein
MSLPLHVDLPTGATCFMAQSVELQGATANRKGSAMQKRSQAVFDVIACLLLALAFCALTALALAAAP